MSTLACLHTLEVGKLSLVQSFPIRGHCILPRHRSMSALPRQPVFAPSSCPLTLLEKTHLCQFLVTPFWGVIGNGAMQTIIEGWARELQTLYM